MNNLDLRYGDPIQYCQDGNWVKATVDAIHDKNKIVALKTELGQLVILTLDYQPHLDSIAAPL